MTDFILRLTEPDEYGSTLQLFTDEDEFTGYLAGIISMAHESGLGPLIGGMWGWSDHDDRFGLELELVWTKSQPDGWTDHHYRLVRTDGEPFAEGEFTVQLDDRRQEA